MDNTIHWLEPLSLLDTSPRQNVKLSSADTAPYIKTPLHETLSALKDKIESPSGQWDDAKKITNPYEHIFLSLHSRVHLSMSARHPLSRSYFKMVEIWEQMKRDAGLSLAETVRESSHSAEGPGGFLEAIQDLTKRSAVGIPMITMTLNSTEKQIPGFRKSQALMRRYPMIRVTYGSDGTGNLYSIANQESFTREATAHVPNASLYTADGGFDFSADFNGQELTIQRLLVAEFLAGLTTLKPGPSSVMVVKLFDITFTSSVELLYVMSMCFDRAGLIKPLSSRPANSERYWIGIGYRGAPAWMLELFRRMVATDSAQNGWARIFDELPIRAWSDKLRQFQEEIERHQINTIQKTLNLIQSGDLRSRESIGPELYALVLTNITKSRNWCCNYGIPVNARFDGIPDTQVAEIYFREIRAVRAAIPVSHSRMSLRTLFQRGRPPGVRSSDAFQLLPTALAWRSELPASVMGRTPFQTVSETPPVQTEVASAPAPDRTESLPASDLPIALVESHESWPALVSTGHRDE